MIRLAAPRPQRVILPVNAGTTSLARPHGAVGPAGPPGEAGPPGGSDASFAAWVSDDTPSQTRAALDARYRTVFWPSDYGAVGDGVADDTTALQDCLDAAEAAGGGIVHLWGPLGQKDYRTTGRVYGGNGVTVYGAPGTELNPGDAGYAAVGSRIICDGSAAEFLWGQWVGAHERPGTLKDVTIDGNASGSATGILKMQCVSATLENVTIKNGIGDGLMLDIAQNNTIINLKARYFPNGTAVQFDNGAGGNRLYGGHITDAKRSYEFAETTPGPGGYPFASDNVIQGVVAEVYTDSLGEAIIYTSGGTANRFVQCAFANNPATGLSSGALVVMETTGGGQPQLAFDGCYFVGNSSVVDAGIDIKGTSVAILSVAGNNTFQNVAAAYRVSTAQSAGAIGKGVRYIPGSTVKFAATGAGNFAFWRDDAFTGTFYKLPDPTGAHAGQWPIVIAKPADAGMRFIVTNEGALQWGNGASFTAVGTLKYDAAIGAVSSDRGLSASGKTMRGTTDVVAGTGANIVTDASAGGPVYTVSLTGTGSIASWTISNATDRQEITIAVYRVGAQSMVWPSTNVRYAGNTPPAAPAAGTITFVHLRRMPGLSMWLELGRSVDVPVA